jgi:hypothetical protein
MDFPEIMRPAYAVADFAADPPSVVACADLAGLAAQVQALRRGRAMETPEPGLLVGSTGEDRRRTLAAVIRHADGSVAHDLRLLFQAETFEVVRAAIRLAGQPRRAA